MRTFSAKTRRVALPALETLANVENEEQPDSIGSRVTPVVPVSPWVLDPEASRPAPRVAESGPIPLPNTREFEPPEPATSKTPHTALIVIAIAIVSFVASIVITKYGLMHLFR